MRLNDPEEEDSRMKMNWNRLALIVAALAVLAALLAPAVEAGEYRLTAHIDEPFEINGTMYPAGSLSIRQLGDYTPTSTLNEIWVGDQCLGMVLAADNSAPGEELSDSLFFERATLGHLVLTGFAYRGQRAQDLSPIGARTGDSSMLLASR
jgi:hypothetical protein